MIFSHSVYNAHDLLVIISIMFGILTSERLNTGTLYKERHS